MPSADASTTLPAARRAGWRFVAITLATPSIAGSLGVDGGQIFQILAVEDLHLDPRAIGVAFGMGVLSVPFQLLAARFPLWRARRNLQWFMVVAAGLCWVLAALVAAGAAGNAARLALAVTVVAELDVSVLYAPAWQPLLSHALGTEARQSLNARWRAGGSLIVAGLLVVFGLAGGPLRAAILLAVGAVALALAVSAGRLPGPRRAETAGTRAARPAGGRGRRSADRPPLPSAMRLVFVAVALVGPASWPLFLVHAEEALWPTANLGLIGAVQFAGSLLAAVTWRPTSAGVSDRAVRAGALLGASGIAVLAVPAPVEGRFEAAVVVVTLGLAAAARTVVLMALLESVHRLARPDTSVRALVILDVIGSTCMQVALAAAGFVIALGAAHPDWPVDPYRLSVTASALGLLGLLVAVRRRT